MHKHVIEIKNLNVGSHVLGTIERVPVQAHGWQWVRYNGRRYQLFGGIRTPEFIDLCNPLKRRPSNLDKE